ncbi:MAG: hypothetical protein ACTSU5_09880 [Promethearchaeota archaeon]
MCRQKVEHLTHVCTSCGRVSDSEDMLCFPVPLDEATKAKWREIPERGDAVLTCKNCHQPITPPGHVCDPILPYTCKYCGTKVTSSRHMCAEIVNRAKYYCKICERLGVEKGDVCAPVEFK